MASVKEMVETIASLSEVRKRGWSKADLINPDQDWADYILHLPQNPPLQVIEALLKTFDDSIDDGGTQEIVIGYLTVVPRALLLQALTNQMAHLKTHAPSWLEDLETGFIQDADL
ncbi:hypothetical protein TRP8649_04298 [Pelagimonas phthalicica]|uniref:Uncharacterized protein n=1 Tax=Pelagimonas phthalicica TaxID=1037362 RepID=A0A238JJ49_9RHOB|nr:hypothetical protein [Pelagimonas phthalicica]TDS89990.1 hypothetical protein CLV87_4045 [Pelagimonas phthalicica]SMX30157.1 hypothetical protein TRP8649_04298 [Pelagimonas phthalicica]